MRNFVQLKRAFSASRMASVQVPLALHGIDGRYATALFTAAAKKDSLPKVEGDLKQIAGLLERDPAVATFLENPLIAREKKKEGVAIILGQGKYSDLTTNFFNVLAENGRLGLTTKILSSFAELTRAARGEVAVTVTSAVALDSKTLNKVRDVLAKGNLLEAGAKLSVTNTVDPQIIGGLVIEVGGKTIDLSVSSKITKLNNLLNQPV
ncbi:OSCP/delta subunit of ATPase [Gorgonomyces haynaldii]|nr:OSCP/delta subunit of ATPase [Gorgonomyces haynaldii]